MRGCKYLHPRTNRRFRFLPEVFLALRRAHIWRQRGASAILEAMRSILLLSGVLLLPSVLLLPTVAGAASPKIVEVRLARSFPAAPGQSLKSFAPRDRTFHSVVRFDHAVSGEKVKAVWIVENAGGLRNYRLAEKTLSTRRMDVLHFATSIKRDWPRGKYRLDIFLNGRRAAQKYFAVQ